MPRPEGVSEEQWKRWEELAAEAYKKRPLSVGGTTEVLLAGYWLESVIRPLEGITENEVEMCVGAAGQIMLGRDPWDVAKKMFEQVNQGIVYCPGPELGGALLAGELDPVFGPGVDVVTCEGVERMLQLHGVKSITELKEKIVSLMGAQTQEEAEGVLLDRLAEEEARLPKPQPR